jgi:hypothetical protein
MTRQRLTVLPSLPSRARGGWASILVILIVVVIIMIVLLNGILSQDPHTQVTQANKETERTREAACAMNRRAVETNLIPWQINHMGETPSVETLRELVHGNTCPSGGVFLMAKDGTVFCTKHLPPPAGEMKNLIKLYEPTPTPTPASSETLPPDMTIDTLLRDAGTTPTATPAPISE